MRLENLLDLEGACEVIDKWDYIGLGERTMHLNDAAKREMTREIIAAAVSGIESETFWMIPDEYTLLRGTLWTGPPSDGKGYPVIVVRLNAKE